MSHFQHWRERYELSSSVSGLIRRIRISLRIGVPRACVIAGAIVLGNVSPAVVAIAADSPPAATSTTCAAPKRQKSADATGFTEVAPGHYVHRGVHEDFSPGNLGDIANTGFIIGTESVVVVDPGSSIRSVRRLRRAIAQVTDLPVSHIVLSHYHPDHVLGGGVFRTVETIVAHANYSRARAQRGQFYRERFGYLLNDAPAAVAELQVSLPIAPGESLVIDPGGRQLEITAWPVAHTDNDLSVYDRSTRTLWASDLIFRERVPVLDGNLQGWISAMPILAELAPELVIPGHGTPGSWNDVAQAQRHYLVDLRNATRQAIASGMSLSEAVASVGREHADQWQLFELHHAGNVSKAYTELEWE